LFEAHGYRVQAGPGPDAFLIDLVAELTCPVCRLPVRVAICCAAHAYRADLEIAEFHQASRSGYNARAYVSTQQPAVWECCREYGIEPLDPGGDQMEGGDGPERTIPLLHGPITGHERASRRSSENSQP
jgi:hypothetical protein